MTSFLIKNLWVEIQSDMQNKNKQDLFLRGLVVIILSAE